MLAFFLRSQYLLDPRNVLSGILANLLIIPTNFRAVNKCSFGQSIGLWEVLYLSLFIIYYFACSRWHQPA